MSPDPESRGRRRLASAAVWTAASAAAVEAFRRMGLSAIGNDWAEFSAILLLTCIGARLRVQMPGLDRAVSLAPVFAFAGVVRLHPAAAWAVVVLAEAFESLTQAEGKGRARRELADRAFAAIVAAPAIVTASTIFERLSGSSDIEWAVAALLAAGAWFGVTSAIHSLRLAPLLGQPPWEVWNRTWFWAGPVYLLAPLGALIVKLLTEAASGWDALLGLVVVSMLYWYARAYFPRLNEQRDHAEQIAEVRQRALETLAVAIEAKDGSTAGHLERVKRLATRIGRRLGCSDGELRTLQLAAVLHDVGKVGVPDYILQKPSRLTDSEFREITAHASIGAGIVAAMRFPEPVDEVVLSHHEHWDGSGYPRGLAGDRIPRLARILTVADCFDALVSDRPYRKALSIDSALDLMRRQRGKIFDPEILDLFLDQLPSFAGELETELADEARLKAAAKSAACDLRQTWIEQSDDEGRVAARIAALRRLSRRPEHFLAFFDAMNVLGTEPGAEGGFRRALETLAAACGAESAHLFEFDGRGRRFEWRCGVGLGIERARRHPPSPDRGPVARALAQRATLTAEIPPPDSELAEAEARPRSLLIAPLVASESLTGLLLLESPRPSAFDDDHLTLIELTIEKFASSLLAARRIRALEADASTDPITSLPNARACSERLEQEVERARRENRPLAILFMDLDGLKPVNDSYGHAAGDALLATAAQRLRSSLRGYDFVGRYGGDEFLAILPGATPETTARIVAHVKRTVGGEPARLGEGCFARASLSVGAAHYPLDGSSAGELLDASDRRMYADKESSRTAVPAASV